MEKSHPRRIEAIGKSSQRTLPKNLHSIANYLASILMNHFHNGFQLEKTPKCNSDDAKNLVVDIAWKTIEKGMTLDKDVQISVENVRTVSHESGLDVYQCAADLTFAKPNMKD